MRVLIACDAFKDALPALDVCRAIAAGMQAARRGIVPVPFPLGDGGEGTAAILTHHTDGRWINLQVRDPLWRTVSAGYGISGDGKTAFIEMAAASGIQLLTPQERNALETTTFGTGELILHAVRQGVKKLVLAIGGSATNDAGMGMAAALGYRFLDRQGQTLRPIGRYLGQVDRIDDGDCKIAVEQLEVTVLCDVSNPLFGPKGAAYVYAPQKGADEAAIALLDEGLQHFGAKLSYYSDRELAHVPGSGAAGGLGAGAMGFLNATLKPGIQTVMELAQFDKALQKADWLITGEGKIDAQTLHGKLIQGVAQRAHAHRVPVTAVCGTLAAEEEVLRKLGLHGAFSVLRKPGTLEEALSSTKRNLEQLGFNLGCLLGGLPS